MRAPAHLFSVGMLLALVVLSAAQGIGKRFTSPKTSDRAPSRMSFGQLLCSEILPVLCTVLYPRGAQRPQVDEGVDSAETACSHTFCQGSLGSISIPMSLCPL